jgi:hypothetical protein
MANKRKSDVLESENLVSPTAVLVDSNKETVNVLPSNKKSRVSSKASKDVSTSKTTTTKSKTWMDIQLEGEDEVRSFP